MTESILTSTKKILGLEESYEAFDTDVLIHINSVLAILTQMGIGPEAGFSIVDKSATWSDFLEDDIRLNSVKTYVYLRVRLLFDPPTTSFHLEALNEQVRELGWRLNVHREGLSWTDPTQSN